MLSSEGLRICLITAATSKHLHGSATAATARLLLLLAAAGAGSAAWTDCASGPSTFKVSTVSLEPSPVKPGDTAQFSIKAESGKDVAGGSVQMIVHYAGMPIWTQTDDLCEKAECPIKKGPVEVKYTQPFPIITPPGSYSVTLDGHAGDDQLFCVTVDFQVVPPQSAGAAQGWAASLKGKVQQAVLTPHRRSLRE
ncbi:hypothetical protein ABPG77_001956 [Micractinium sp. CCAP 211/92]